MVILLWVEDTLEKSGWDIGVACQSLVNLCMKSHLEKKSDSELFEQEVTILSSLRHPNVILYMGVCLDRHEKIIVMESMEKGSLHELLRKEPLDSNKIQKIAQEIALGMNYLHGENIIHRDLTSKNILLSRHMEAKVADFGLSKVKLAESQTYSYTMGSVAWMAPEVIANARNFTKSSDVYSYAIMLWELWTGEDPCPRDVAPVNLANKVLHEDYRPIIPQRVPPSWQELIGLCWHTDPNERPPFERILQILSNLQTLYNQHPPELNDKTSFVMHDLDQGLSRQDTGFDRSSQLRDLQDVRVSEHVHNFGGSIEDSYAVMLGADTEE